MTKTKAREYLRRAREDIRWAEDAMKDDDPSALYDWLLDGQGALAEIAGALTDCYGDGEGVGGLLYEEE